MPPLSHLTVRQLRDKLKLVNAAIKEEVPELIAEKLFLENLIVKKKLPAGSDFAQLRGYAAIVAGLERAARWVTLDELMEVLAKGGYQRTDSAGRGTINDLLNRYSAEDWKGDKKLARSGETFGLVTWERPSKNTAAK